MAYHEGLATRVELAADGDEPRRDDRAVQHLRKRMCYELNFATSFFITENDRIDGTPGRARFAAKLSREVQATTGALARLEARLAEICGWSSGRGP